MSIGLISYLGFFYEKALIFPSFASSAVVLFMTPRLMLRQVKNVLGGQLVSALVGVTIYKIFGSSWWAISLGVSIALVMMILTDTIHPPGGATAFAAIALHEDYLFVIKPVFLGMVLLILIALMIQFCAGLKKDNFKTIGSFLIEARNFYKQFKEKNYQ
nr:HPP family protein [Carboxydothermus pertinax]